MNKGSRNSKKTRDGGWVTPGELTSNRRCLLIEYQMFRPGRLVITTRPCAASERVASISNPIE